MSNRIYENTIITGNLDVSGAFNGIKRYVAILNQTGATPPTVTIIENTIGAVVWTRSVGGVYQATLAGAFTVGKTSVIISNGNTSNVLSSSSPSVNNVTVNSFNISGSQADGLISSATLLIEVFP